MKSKLIVVLMFFLTFSCGGDDMGLWTLDDTNITNFGVGVVDMVSPDDTTTLAEGTTDPLGTPIALSAGGETTQIIGAVAWNTQAVLNKVWIPDTVGGIKTYTVTNLTDWRAMVADLKTRTKQVWTEDVSIELQTNLTLTVEATDQLRLDNVLGNVRFKIYGSGAGTRTISSNTFSIAEFNYVDIQLVDLTEDVLGGTLVYELTDTGNDTPVLSFENCRAKIYTNYTTKTDNYDVTNVNSASISFVDCSNVYIAGGVFDGGYIGIFMNNSFAYINVADNSGRTPVWGIRAFRGGQYVDEANTMTGSSLDRKTSWGSGRMYDTGAGVWGVSYDD